MTWEKVGEEEETKMESMKTLICYRLKTDDGEFTMSLETPNLIETSYSSNPRSSDTRFFMDL